MSVATPPAATTTAASPKSTTAEALIGQRIEEARSALWWSELTRTTLKVLIGSMLALLTWLVMDHWIYSPGPIVRTLCFVALVATAAWYFIRRAWPVMTSHVTSEYAAWALEQDHPDYRQQLTSYVTLKQDSPTRGVRARVVRAIGAKAASLLKTHDALPGEATGTFKWWITAAGIFAILAAYCVGSPKSSLASAKRLVAPLASIAPALRVQISDVMPGNAETLAGRDVEISADINGLDDDEPVICRWSSDGPVRESELVIDANGDRYIGILSLDHSASGVVRYTVEAGDATAGPFELYVENVPVVEIESVKYEPPGYTKRKTRTTSSPAITAIDGTKIRITSKTNRAVAKAELQFNPKTSNGTVRATGGRMPVSIGDDGVTLTADVVLRSARGKSASVELESYRIRVWDSNDQSNPDPIVYPIKVIPDLPPEVSIVVPKKSPVEVPVSAQQTIEVHAMDADYELEQVSLSIERGIDTLETPIVWQRPEDGSGKGNQVAEYRFRPLDHRLRAGDVVRISATAIDNRNVPGDRTFGPNERTTDPIEIRIVEDAEELPEEGTDNDGLSKPDDRPASDVDQSEKGGSGEQQSGDQGSEGSGGQGGQGEDSNSQSSQEQGSQDQGSQGQGSEGEGSDDQESQGQDSQGQEGQGSEAGDQTSQGQDSSGDDSTGQDSAGQNPDGDGTSGEGSQQQSPNNQSPENSNGDQQSPQKNGSENGNSEQMNQDGGGNSQNSDANQPNGQQDASQPNDASDGQSPNSGDQQNSGQQGGTQENKESGQQDGASNQSSDNSQSDSGQSKEGQRNSDQTGADGSKSGSDTGQGDQDESQSGSSENSEANGDDTNSQQTNGSDQQSAGSGADGQQSSSDQDSKSPPKHDGEAIERIKDYIEKQKQKDKEQSGSSQSDDMNDQGDKSNQGDGNKSESGSQDKDASDQQQGSGESDNDGTKGEQSKSGESENGQPESSDSGSKDSESEQSQSGDSKPSQGADGQSDDGTESDQDKTQQDQNSGDSQSESSGDSGDNNSQQSDSESGKQSDGKQQDGSQSSPSDSQSSSSEGSNSDNSSDSNQKSDSSNSGSPASQSASSGDGSGSTAPPEGADSSDQTPPPPPDLEYAKKATDMVLDYLDETRDNVDEDLLKDLDWSKEDLKRFRERWEKVREMEQPAGVPEPSNEFEDALRSLGLQSDRTPSTGPRETADSLRNVRDSGNRRKAPPAIRDAFEAFRRRN